MYVSIYCSNIYYVVLYMPCMYISNNLKHQFFIAARNHLIISSHQLYPLYRLYAAWDVTGCCGLLRGTAGCRGVFRAWRIFRRCLWSRQRAHLTHVSLASASSRVASTRFASAYRASFRKASLDSCQCQFT